jgi:hypothetical protein
VSRTENLKSCWLLPGVRRTPSIDFFENDEDARLNEQATWLIIEVRLGS